MQSALTKISLPEEFGLPILKGRKSGETEQLILLEWLQDMPNCPSSLLVNKLGEQYQISISVRHINRLRVKWNLNRGKGRPRKPKKTDTSEVLEGELIKMTPPLPLVGLHIFADWLINKDLFHPILKRLDEVIETYRKTHPNDDFALLHHQKATLDQRFQALFFLHS